MMSIQGNEAQFDEEARLNALYRYNILDTPTEAGFDDIVALAAQILDAPIAAINLIDRHRQWFKAELGLGVREMPLDDSICKFAILESGGMVVPDLLKDDRFSCNPLVNNGPKLRFYAGEMLETSDGLPLGTLCVLDDKPRPENLTEQQQFALKALAKQVMAQMELRLDISRAQKVEQALRESETKFRVITDAMPQMVWATQPSEKTDYFNERILEFVGQPKEVITGAGWANFIHPDDLAEATLAWHTALETGMPLDNEYRLRHHSGEYRWVLGRALPMQKTDGTSQWMGTFTDIHDQRKAAEQLRLANERKDEFLAMLAHELRNPLAPVANAVQLLRLNAKNESRVQEITNIIERQVIHMTELVNDLLDVSRITQGLVELKKDPVNIKVVITQATEQVRPLIESKGHTLHTTIAAEHAVVIGDQTRLIQALSNILANAAKYTVNGGDIKLELYLRANQVQISVQDNGIGIEPSLLPYIFDMFTQAQRTPDRAQGGLGLGLTLVKRIIELHNGSVIAASAGPDTGSLFTILLPLAANKTTLLKNVVDSRTPSASGNLQRILIVDDNIDAAHLLMMLLEGYGHEVRVEVDGLKGLETALTYLPDIIILDIGLPYINGYELANRLKNQNETKQTVLIAVTGYGQEEDKRLAKAAGFDFHLVKPVNMVELRSLIERQS